MTLYERVKGSTDKWVKSNPEKIIKMDEFSAVNASMSGSTTVPTYNALGQEMEYRFVETGISYKGQKVELTEKIDEDGNPIRTFELKNEAGNTVAFTSKEEVSADGTRKVVNSIQDEITYTIDKIWVAPLEPKEVSFALYQQGQGQVNTYVGTVTLDGEADTGDQTGDWLRVCRGTMSTATAMSTLSWKCQVKVLQPITRPPLTRAATIPLLSQMHPVRVTASWCANAGLTTATCSTVSR